MKENEVACLKCRKPVEFLLNGGPEIETLRCHPCEISLRTGNYRTFIGEYPNQDDAVLLEAVACLHKLLDAKERYKKKEQAEDDAFDDTLDTPEKKLDYLGLRPRPSTDQSS